MNARMCFRMLAIAAIMNPTLLPASCTRAQGGGFTETFDNAALPGWEHSPNVTVVNGALHIGPDGYAFHPGPWANLSLTMTTRLTGEGAAVVT